VHFAKLRLSGFKSFVDPTELQIQPGMTGIVGPNGCGKSNLVEALRWVMGETSAKRMRGGEMDDVIFGGTTARPARNIAEVALVLDNVGRAAPKPYDEYDEIEVVRRIERSAGSGYRVNGREVRARDVQLLFADAASGAHSTAMVSQGRVGAIINAKPSERRALLEEAAGITGLHSRRHEAELRLKGAEANLARLDDVLVTLEAQLEALHKQARQAQRYRRLSDHIRRAEAIVLQLRWLQAMRELSASVARLSEAEIVVADLTQAALAGERERETAAAALPALRQTEAAASAELQRLVLARQALDEEERRVATARANADQRLRQLIADQVREEDLTADASAAMARLEDERAGLTGAQAEEGARQQEAAAALAAAAQDVATLDAELTRLTERVAADEARRAALQRQQREAGERQARLAQRRHEIAQQRATAEAQAVAPEVAEAAAEAVLMAEAEVERTRAAGDSAEHALRDAQAAETAARAPMQAAETKRAKLRAEVQALVELLAAASDRRWKPLLDSITVEAGFEAALGAALGDDLTAPVDPAAPAHWHELADYDSAQALPAGVAALAEHVAAPPSLARRLKQIGIAEDGVAAAALQERLLPGQRLVSRDGGLWRWDGYRRAAGTPSAAGQRLRQRNRLAEYQEELRLAEAEANRLLAVLEDAQRAVRQHGEAERGARQAARDAVGVLAGARDREAKIAREAAAAASRIQALAEQAERLEIDLAETAAQAEAAQEAIAALPDPAIGREETAALRARLAECRTIHVTRQGERDRLVREAQARQQRLTAIGFELRSWQGRVDAAERQRATLAERRAEVTAEIEVLSRRPEEIAAQRETLAETIESSTERRNQAADALAAGETRLAAAEKGAKAADASLGGAREERVRAQSLKEQAEQGRDGLAQQILEKLDCVPDAILATAGIEADEAMPEMADAVGRLERLTRERDNMGPVNLVAESEAAEIEERLTGLVREREDLTGAIARLRQGISALNREGRERLLAAFAQVNEHFTALFVRLFGGGQAHLKLEQAEEDSDDPLQSGLEIMASPPGKRLQALSLLSGGEQALTALALLFAVFLTNPAPICVLDEVDAPLDDANVDRFCRLVDEIAESAETRFLIITHHRLTMARVDRLFGVTMAEKGVSQLVSVDLQAAERLRQTA
jgi:chromosome segregation protein